MRKLAPSFLRPKTLEIGPLLGLGTSISQSSEATHATRFEAVKAMAQKAREENDRLKERIVELEAAILEMDSDLTDSGPPRPIKRNKPKPSY